MIGASGRDTYYHIPVEHEESKENGLIMLGFYRNPRGEEEREMAKRSGSAVPQVNDTNDTWYKWVASTTAGAVMKDMKYVHCEAVFSKSLFDGITDWDHTAVAYVVYRTGRDGGLGKVEVRERSFLAPLYDWVFLSLPKESV